MLRVRTLKQYGLLLALLALLLANPAWAERVALVFGNSQYAHAPYLNNPRRDAEALARALTGLGFQVTGPLLNQSKAQMDAALKQFGRQAQGATAAAVYFSGHGVEVRGQNYLLPTDAVLERDRDVSLEAVGLEVVLDQIGGARDYRLVILDACRDNPLANTMRRSDGTKSAFRGLAPVEPSGQTYIAYAARAGQRAQDGPAGAHSPYAAALLKYLPQPGLPLERLFGSVREEVLRTTTRTQEPWLYGTFGAEPIYLAGLAPEPVPVSPSPAVDHDHEAWKSAETCGTAACFRAYLKTHPQGRYAELARARLEPAVGSAAPAPAAEPTCCKLWVKATPADAKVRIMSIVPAYQDGLVVARGRHRIRVERSGYEAYDQWVEINQAEQVVMVDLSKSAAPVVAERLAPARPGFEPEMVRIPGGSFQMGSPASEAGRDSDERPHRVTVRDFALGKHEVTVGEFKRFVESTGHRTDAERNVGDAQGCWVRSDEEGKGSYRAGHSWRNPGYPQSDAHPVVCVSWNDAVAYTVWLNQETGQSYRLPTEAEWEYAARAGTTTARYWGNDPNQACRYANVADQAKSPKGLVWTEKHDCSDGYWYPAPVGRFRPNAWQLNDMLGNVWEWTCSLYDQDYGGAEQECNYKDTSGPRSLRGGSWLDRPAGVRSADRGWNTPTNGNTTGFRLARSL